MNADDEMVEAAARAIYERINLGLLFLRISWSSLHESSREPYRLDARAAISAIAPMIRAAALEEAAKVADAHSVKLLAQAGYDMCGMPFRRVTRQEDVETHNSWVSKANAAGSIRSAIRALKEKP